MICKALMDMGVFCTLQDESEYLNHSITSDILQTILVDGEIPDDLDYDELNAKILENYKEHSCDQVEKDYVNNLNTALNQASKEEISTWPTKRECALAYQAGTITDSQTSTLNSYAVPRGETLEAYVASVIAKITEHEQHSSRLEGIKKQSKDSVNNATSIVDIDIILNAIEW